MLIVDVALVICFVVVIETMPKRNKRWHGRGRTRRGHNARAEYARDRLIVVFIEWRAYY
jgi:hypothetical protein